MSIIDVVIFAVYFIAMVLVGLYFYRNNKDKEDYYVGGRQMSSGHIGLSVVATDVGGGFSIGLGIGPKKCFNIYHDTEACTDIRATINHMFYV